ncbi:MAG: hypothetical protein ACNS62_10985 [Candidatus Cyclobacteriaceae bacterium M3_2C_046]
MNWIKVVSAVLLVVALGLGYYLFNSIRTKIEEEKRIERIERSVIEKLKMIREAEIAYQAVMGQYTSDWDKLISFIDTGKIYNVQKKETVITLEYGADSIHIEVDTLGEVAVRDSIFPASQYPNFDPTRLPIIPGSGGKRFDIFADKITKNNIEVDVIEVKDVDPVNPTRDEESEIFNRKPLRFGSRTDVTTTGNWE